MTAPGSMAVMALPAALFTLLWWKNWLAFKCCFNLSPAIPFYFFLQWTNNYSYFEAKCTFPFLFCAGGHNVTISLQSRTGHTHMPSVVGVLVFTQFWFWFPLSHFLSLSFTPTSVIGLNKDLKVSAFSPMTYICIVDGFVYCISQFQMIGFQCH